MMESTRLRSELFCQNMQSSAKGEELNNMLDSDQVEPKEKEEIQSRVRKVFYGNWELVDYKMQRWVPMDKETSY
jgi:hypothetical protein